MRDQYPLYVAWLEFTLDLLDRADRLPRSIRFTLSDRMINLTLEVMEDIVEAIYSRDRIPILRRMNLSLEKMRVYVRICYEKKLLSPRQYEFLFERIECAGRMAGGWARNHDQGQPPF